jgi:hypothetical protein
MAEQNGGLLGSLEGLSLRASLAAICAPLLVLAMWFVFEHFLGGAVGTGCNGPCPPAEIPRPLFAFEVATFFLVPMLAMAGAVTSAMTAAISVARRRPRLLWDMFLVALGLWAMMTAVYYVVVVVPAITS